MAAGDLTTLANVRQYLDVTNDDSDALFARLITAASQYIRTWSNRDFVSQSYTRKINGNGTRSLPFPDYPVSAVASLMINGVNVPASPDNIRAGYVFDDRFLYLIGYQTGPAGPGGLGYHMAKGFQNVQISYTAGYSPVPLDVEQACIEMIASRYKARSRVDEVSKNLSGMVVAFSQKDLNDSIKTILGQYKKVIPL